MALSTYSDLKTAIANNLARTDLTDQMDDFIDLAEARLGRELKTRSQESSTNVSTGDEFVSLPTDLRRVRLVRITTGTPSVLTSNTPQDLFANFDTGQGRPTHFTIIGEQLILRPIPDTTYTVRITMGTGMDSLSDSTTTNTVLTRYPDAYLYGCLAAAYRYLLDEARSQFYDALATQIIEKINTSEEGAKYGSGVLVQQALVVV